MSRKLLLLAVLIATFTVIFDTTDAEATCCRTRCRSHRSCNYGGWGGGCGYGNFAYRGCAGNTWSYSGCNTNTWVNYGCQSTPYLIAVRARPTTTCCVAQTACALATIPASFIVPQPGQAPVAPALAPIPNI